MADYAHLRQLEAKVTPGPFRIERRDLSDGAITYIVHADHDVAWFSEDVNNNARVDAQHYVAARHALPGLLDEMERLKTERDAARAEVLRLRGTVEVVKQLDDLDCGDNSCGFARHIGGMRTNGGCRCIERARPGVRPKIIKLVRALRAALGTDHE